MRLPRPHLVFCLLVLAAAALPAAPAAAASGPCVVGGKEPTCTIYRGSVPYQANDGDTVDVRLDGAPQGARLTRVRLAGVQAMELTDYGTARAGDCEGVQAARRLDELLDLGGRRVRLAAQDPTSVSRGRALRSVAVRIAGHWIDVGQQLISEGLALWVPFHTEWNWNAAYSRTSRLASLIGAQGLWKGDACGAGPSEGVPLRAWVSSNPAGPDSESLQEEYMTVRNEDPAQAVDLSGWWVRDSGLRRYVLAPGTVLGPGAHVTVHVGEGIDTPADRYWNLTKPLFDNATGDETAIGDGGYLFDPQGDLRASTIYPCRVECDDRHGGAVRLRTHPSGTEYVIVQNTSGSPVDLFGYRLFSSPHQYAFPPGTVLPADGELRVDIKGAPEDDTQTHRHWGLPANILANGGDRISAQSFEQVEIACDSWGTSSCR
jgi:endonuclease YncB( thermonuclease family)